MIGVRQLHKPGSNLHFKVMAFMFRLRDVLLPRKRILLEVGIQPGFHILDYGCGPGGYLIPLAELVGPSGNIYALDIHPLAIQRVQIIVSRKRLKNVDVILSDCKTGLKENSIDVVLLYDTLHALNDPDGVLKELHRVLKPGGVLSLSERHMKENKMISRVTDGGLFRLSKTGKRTSSFSKEE
jgi:ubiquinone/menaquinone biosynthesis C-methylase UbiE